MLPKAYLETTIISYLTAWRSPELVMAANYIANATLRHGIEATCRECGFASPVICTPLELME